MTAIGHALAYFPIEMGTAKALSISIGKIVDFMSRGGEIDVHIRRNPIAADNPVDQNVVAEMCKSYDEIKRLEEKLRLLKGKDE